MESILYQILEALLELASAVHRLTRLASKKTEEIKLPDQAATNTN